MTEPASELIALADDYLRNGAAESGAHELIRQLADCLRTAANQSGSERAGVESHAAWQQSRGVAWDIIDQAISDYDEWMLDDDYDAMPKLHGIIKQMRARKALYRDGPEATPPAQPAPESDYDYETNDPMGVVRNWPSEAPSTHGKPDGAVREAVCCSAISPCEYQRTHRTGVCETCQKAAAIDRLDVKAEAKSQEPAVVSIKPLEWYEDQLRNHENPAWNATTDFGSNYRVFKAWRGKEKKAGWIGNGEFHNTEADAKAAAQSDFEQRIRSALIPTTKPEAPAVSVDAIKDLVRSFHRNSCYPEAGTGELNAVVNAIAALIAEGR